MKLFHRKFGAGRPIIVLHGLYGSSDNWVTIARNLSSEYEIWLVDLRNHGSSPHSGENNYRVMADDLFEFINENQIIKASIVGHSMGGKLAMYFADNYPQVVKNLVVIDISPKSYVFSLNLDSNSLNHKQIMEGMMKIDFSGIKRREEIEDNLAKYISNEKIRQFLMKNVKRNKDMSFGWILNIESLYKNLENILEEFRPKLLSGQQNFQVLFIKGSESNYIEDDDLLLIKSIYQDASIQQIENAGHWLHIEQPSALIDILKAFLK